MTDSNSSQEIPLLTFNSLYNILREEKKNKMLQKLPEEFYLSLSQFLLQKRKEVLRLKNDESAKDKYKKERFVLNNSKKIIDELLALRTSKISEIGIKNSIYEEEFLSKENILKLEDKFLKNVEHAIKDLKKEALKRDGN